jgi:hypothetical protein
MKKVSQTLLGLSAFLSVPSTIEEFNQQLKGEGTALDFANNEAYYRGIAPKVRAAYLKAIEKSFGLSPAVLSEKTVGEGDAAKVVKTYEKDTAFLKRIRAAGRTDEELTPLLQKAFDSVGWDLSSTRSTGPNKKDVEAADFYINAVAAGESTWDRIVGNFQNANPGLEIERGEDGTVSRDAMAEACKVNRVRLESSKML